MDSKEPRIVSEIVVDKNGMVIGKQPNEFPKITNKAKELIVFLETGLNYKVV